MAVAGDEAKLKAGALSLPGALMQAVGHIGPTAGVITSLVFITSIAGVTSPIAFLLGGVICLGIAVGLTQLAKRIGGAGGFFQYVARTVGPRAGFFTAWMYFLYDPLVYGVVITWFCGTLQDTLKAQYGWNVPWWVTFLVAVAVLTFLSIRGVELAIRFVVLFGILELVFLLGLAVSGLLSPGNGGVNLEPFNPGNAPSVNALYLGVIFTILTYTGFESVAPLAEETANPRRNLPRAILFSVIFMVAVYVIATWGIMIGWGTSNLDSFVASPDPVFQLARNLWGGAWLLILFATFNSSMACAAACGNASTRVFFGMGRSGALPSALAKVHPTYRTPTNAILLQAVLALVFGLGLSAWIGPIDAFFFVGVLLTLGMIIVYSFGNLGVYLLYRREHRSEFNWFLHAVLPLITTAALLWVGWKSIEGFHITSPQNYLDWTPAIVVGWAVVGLGVMAYVSRSGKQEWLTHAGQSVGDYEIGMHEVPQSLQGSAGALAGSE